MARSLLSTRNASASSSQVSWNKRSDYERFPESHDRKADGITVTYGIEMGPSVKAPSQGKTQGVPDV